MRFLSLLIFLLVVGAVASLFVGAIALPVDGAGTQINWDAFLPLLWASRVPRTLALIFAGAGTAVCGLILQMLLRNRYVEPTMTGTTEGACLGVLLVLLIAPDMPVFARMLAASGGALAITLLFMLILSRLPLRSVLIVPLTGIVLSGVVDAVTTFLAYRFELQQSLAAWRVGDFSQVLAGRWELLWLAAGLSMLACLTADRFTIAGLGRDTATNLGLNHRGVMALGLCIVSATSACVLVTVGILPFLGLVVPNLVSLLAGDNLRRGVPLVALAGAVLTLLCDLLGRVVAWPFEIPIGVIIGIVGGAAFLWLLLRERARVG